MLESILRRACRGRWEGFAIVAALVATVAVGMIAPVSAVAECMEPTNDGRGIDSEMGIETTVTETIDSESGIAARSRSVGAFGDPPSTGGGTSNPRRSGDRIAAQPPVRLEKLFSSYISEIGVRGIYVGDLDGDDDNELITTASRNDDGDQGYWYVVDHDGTDYSMVTAVFPYEEPLKALRLGRSGPDISGLEVFVVLPYRLLVYDGKTLTLKREIGIERTFARGFEVGNVDSDASMEAVICDGFWTQIYDLDSGALQLMLPDVECRDLDIGEIDGSPGVEVVVANGWRDGYVLDGETGEVEWLNPEGFGDQVEVADLDGDGLDEIVSGREYYPLVAWNGDTRDHLWENAAGLGRYGSLAIGDLEDDGELEVIHASMGVYALDGRSGELRWSFYDDSIWSVDSIAVGDIDDDGRADFIFGSGATSTKPDRLHVVDQTTGDMVWTSDAVTGPFYGLADGDVDADGDNELISTAYNAPYDRNRSVYNIYDAATKLLEFTGPIGNWGDTRLWDIEVANVDDDPQLEILFPTEYSFTIYLACWDGIDHSMQWEHPVEDGLTVGSLTMADADGDGETEIVMGTALDNSSAPGIYVYLLNAEHGYKEWESVDLTPYIGRGSVTLLRASDVDGDGLPELVVARHGHDLMMMDPVDDTFRALTNGASVTAIATADLDSAGPEEIVFGSEDGHLAKVDATSGEVVDLAGPFGGAIGGLEIADFDDDGVMDFVLTAAGRLHLILGDTMKSWWVSDFLGSEDAGAHDSLKVGDFDRDGRLEIWVNAGKGHAVFEFAGLE